MSLTVSPSASVLGLVSIRIDKPDTRRPVAGDDPATSAAAVNVKLEANSFAHVDEPSEASEPSMIDTFCPPEAV